MQIFAWGINKPNVQDERSAIINEHWSFMDQFDDQLIARGPTLSLDGAGAVTGSIHVAELKNLDEAKRLAFDYPFAKAGLFKEIILSKFTAGLKRTQFEFNSQPDTLSFFIHCPAKDGAIEARKGHQEDHQEYCLSFDDHMICRGALHNDDDTWNGSLFFVELQTKEDAAKFLENEPYNKIGLFDAPTIYPWKKGGRENLSKSET
jgi:uncharacterized protein YciI